MSVAPFYFERGLSDWYESAMVTTENLADEPLPFLGAWSPMGRTPRPCDMPADVLVQYRKQRQFWTLLITWTLIVVFLSITFARHLLGVGSNESLLILQIAVILPVAIIVGYRRYCWVAQRLHDIGHSSWPYVKRLLSALLIPVVVTAAAVAIIRIPAPVTSDQVIFGIGYTTLLLAGGFLLLIAILWAQARINAPFNRYLHRTPGEPGSNRFGPPPVTR